MTETEFAMVSEWMPNGNINQFVKEHSDANRFELVSFPSGPRKFRRSLTAMWLPQLNDVARGLIYMHDQGMIHGDLKGVRLAKLKPDPSIYWCPPYRPTSWSIKPVMLASRISGSSLFSPTRQLQTRVQKVVQFDG